MTLNEFKSSQSDPSPPQHLSEPLQALWWDANDDWNKAHSIVQVLEDPDAYWVHAYLHREEGDLGNSNYWYRRAGRDMPKTSLEQEWQTIATALLSRAR